MKQRQEESVASGLEVVVRAVTTQQEYRQCVELQRDTWGPSFAELVPPALLQVTQKVGGIAAGAFDTSDRMVGFVYGLTGLKDGELTHWSHMLAVRQEWEGRGLGRRLKVYQRDRLLALGVGTALWTFDPLVSRNAHFNLNRLGVTVVQYVPDMYGDTGSELHSGLGTDRLLVRWDLASERVERALTLGRVLTEVVPPHASTVCLDRDGEPLSAPARYPEDPLVKLAIPSDIQTVKTESSDLGRQWREATRQAFLWYLSRGYEIQGFERQAAAKTRSYILIRNADPHAA